MVFLHNNRTPTKKEIGTRNGVLMWQAWPCCLLVECRLWTRKVDEHIKQTLMGNASRNMKDSVAESNVDYDGLTQDILKEKNISIFGLEIVT